MPRNDEVRGFTSFQIDKVSIYAGLEQYTIENLRPDIVKSALETLIELADR